MWIQFSASHANFKKLKDAFATLNDNYCLTYLLFEEYNMKMTGMYCKAHSSTVPVLQK